MEIMFYTKFNISWRAAHRHRITDREFEDVNIANLCDELSGYLGGGGGGPRGRLSLGAAAVLVNGTAVLLQQKAEHTLKDTFALTQKIILKNYQTDSDCEDSEDELESEGDDNPEVDVYSGTSVTPSSKRSANPTKNLEMSKRIRSSEHTGAEGDSSDDISDPGSSSNALENVPEDTHDDDNHDSQPNASPQEDEDIPNDIQDKTVQTCRCLCNEFAAIGGGRRGIDPNLKLGVMLVYDNYDQAMPSKLLVSSLNPRAKL